MTRLTKLLTYLDAHYPAESWKAYLRDGAPDWPRVAMSGQSMGAGMAAFIGKRVPLAREEAIKAELAPHVDKPTFPQPRSLPAST